MKPSNEHPTIIKIAMPATQVFLVNKNAIEI